MAAGKQIANWADISMYPAVHNKQADQGELVKPRVYLVSMTPQPLRTMAAAAGLYTGQIITDPMDVPKSDALHWFEEMTKTALQTPLEFIEFHFFFEGVTRAFANQLERQRTAAYVQESLRFAVKQNAEFEIVMPPTIEALKDDNPLRVIWEEQVKQVAWAYNSLVDGGIPAEDARGLLPLNTATRVHYTTNLRNLADHAGKRLCTQAQIEWKDVWYGMIQAILNYGPVHERWQNREIIKLFKPVCYLTGKCEFHADSDRFCSIRDRVDAHAANGDSPKDWSDIDPLEPLKEGAARMSPSMARDMDRAKS